MKLTNKLNLPEAVYNLALKQMHPINKESYSVTELLNPTREIILRRRWDEHLEVDVADKITASFGSAVHKLFEENNTSGEAELKMKIQICGQTITGVCDLWHNDTLEDYKTTSVSKVIKMDFEDHIKQTLIYAYMILMRYQKKIRFIRINYLMKDWSKVQAATRTDYPGSPIYVYLYKVEDSDYDMIESFLKGKITEIMNYNDSVDNELPECSDEEKWYTGTTYAVYKKKGDAKAKKVFKSLDEAEQFKKDNNCEYIEERLGENLKCNHYCNVSLVCNCKGGKNGTKN